VVGPTPPGGHSHPGRRAGRGRPRRQRRPPPGGCGRPPSLPFPCEGPATLLPPPIAYLAVLPRCSALLPPLDRLQGFVDSLLRLVLRPPKERRPQLGFGLVDLPTRPEHQAADVVGPSQVRDPLLRPQQPGLGLGVVALHGVAQSTPTVRVSGVL